MKKLLKLSVLFVYLIGAVAHAAEPIKIGVSAPFTGPGASLGIAIRDAAKLAADEINQSGGVLDRQIELVVRDDETKSEVGVIVAKELINKEKVVATLGLTNVGVALASVRIYQEAKIPAMLIGSPDKRILKPYYSEPENYVFRNTLTDDIQIEMIVQELVDNKKYSKIAILADSAPFGQGASATMTAILLKRGITPVAVEKFNQKDMNMTPQLLKAKEAGAQAVAIFAAPTDCFTVIGGMAKIGWKVPVLGGSTLSTTGFINLAKESAEGVVMPVSFIEEPSTPRRKAFLESFYKQTKADRITMPSNAAAGYDGLYLMVAAIRQAGSTEGTKVREALENLSQPVEGVTTTYKKPFSRTNHDGATADMGFMGVIKGGKVVYLNESDRTKGMAAAPKAQSPVKKAKKK